MVYAQIVDYIKKQLQLGDTQEKIRNDLIANGWTEADYYSAIAAISTGADTSSTSPSSSPMSQPTNTQIIKSRDVHPVILSIVVVLLLGSFVGIYFYLENKKEYVAIAEDNILLEHDHSTHDHSEIDTKSASVTTTTTSTNKSDLWPIFDKMLVALRDQNISEYNKYSYRQVPLDQRSQFSQISSFLYSQSKNISKVSYVNKWQDAKQAIYSTEPKKVDTEKSYSYVQSVVKFIYTNNTWKVVNVNPEITWSIAKSTNKLTTAEVDAELRAMFLDTDKDGITDVEEKCIGSFQGDSKCIKTDPNKRDTDGNGLWDGIDASI